jgi:transcriptional regulator with XRE-family HTH domain
VVGLGKKSVVLMPQTKALLATMGEQIKMARLRRKIPVEVVAERAGISRATLWSVEKGAPSVAIGIYAAVLHSLNNMDKDLLLIARDDELGRKLQDLDLPTRKRAPQKRGVDYGNQ